MDRVVPVEEVFKQWKKYNRLIQTINHRYCKNYFAYEEAMNESFFWVQKAVRTYNAKKGRKFSTYLYEILRQQASTFSRSYLRYKAIGKSSIAPDYYSDYEQLTWVRDDGREDERFSGEGKNLDITLDTYLASKEIKKYINRMPPKAKEVFEIIYNEKAENITDVKCAEILKKPISTVRNNKYTALNFLKKCIERKSKWIKELLEDM